MLLDDDDDDEAEYVRTIGICYMLYIIHYAWYIIHDTWYIINDAWYIIHDIIYIIKLYLQYATYLFYQLTSIINQGISDEDTGKVFWEEYGDDPEKIFGLNLGGAVDPELENVKETFKKIEMDIKDVIKEAYQSLDDRTRYRPAWKKERHILTPVWWLLLLL